MNGEIEVLRAESVIFQVRSRGEEPSEAKTVKIEETIVTEVSRIETQERFARLKRSLRKRSRSIL